MGKREPWAPWSTGSCRGKSGLSGNRPSRQCRSRNCGTATPWACRRVSAHRGNRNCPNKLAQDVRETILCVELDVRAIRPRRRHHVVARNLQQRVLLKIIQWQVIHAARADAGCRLGSENGPFGMLFEDLLVIL